jgi:hypothetical protein
LKTAGEEITLSHEHCGYAWVSYEEGLQRLTFKTAKELLAKAHKFLETSPPGSTADQASDQSK